jgi:hypothetical protein
MSDSSGNNTTKQTTKSEPWGPQTPYLKYGMDEATRLYQSTGPQYYPGSTVAGFSPTQQQAQQLGTQRALGGNASMRQAEGVNSDFMSGKYLNSNPYSDQVYQNIQSKVLPSVNSQFMGSGRYGSNLQTDTATRALTEAYSPYASQQYQSGLDRMGQAASMAPTFAANDWTDINALSNIGGQQQQLGQQELNDAAARWDYYQQLPYNKLGQYQNNIGGNYGGTTVGKTQTPQPSMFQQVGGYVLGNAGQAMKVFGGGGGMGGQGFY